MITPGYAPSTKHLQLVILQPTHDKPTSNEPNENKSTHKKSHTTDVSSYTMHSTLKLFANIPIPNTTPISLNTISPNVTANTIPISSFSNRVYTQYYPKVIDDNEAHALYQYLETNIEWEDGVPSKSGFTRKGKPMRLGMDMVLDKGIIDALSKIGIVDGYAYGIYLNYYRDGNDWTPNHTHPGMKQVVISLGAIRTLNVAKKTYAMNNGDIVIFGSAIHGVPKDPNCKQGRISIALFLDK
ncbi:Hypothetical protein HVR_LOCUS96 [uncultured virus]|nr:Hypothetical protein HVR_LOCUS96 [uncultured virus]